MSGTSEQELRELVEKQTRHLLTSNGVWKPDALHLEMARALVIEGIRQLSLLPKDTREVLMATLKCGVSVEDARSLI